MDILEFLTSVCHDLHDCAGTSSTLTYYGNCIWITAEIGNVPLDPFKSSALIQ